MRKHFRSPLTASIHETAEALHAAGVMDNPTMRELEDLCLTPPRQLKPEKSKRTARTKPPATPSSPTA